MTPIVMMVITSIKPWTFKLQVVFFLRLQYTTTAPHKIKPTGTETAGQLDGWTFPYWNLPQCSKSKAFLVSLSVTQPVSFLWGSAAMLALNKFQKKTSKLCRRNWIHGQVAVASSELDDTFTFKERGRWRKTHKTLFSRNYGHPTGFDFS